MSSFGEELRRERELRDISLRDISEATKISLRHLDALERNDFRHLPGGVFNKGFVRAYSQYIGVDPEAMVNAYLIELREQETRRLEQQRREGIRRSAAPAGEEATRNRPSVWRRKWAAVSLLLLAFLVVVTVLGFVVVWLRPRQEPGREVSSPREERSAREVPAAPGETSRLAGDSARSGGKLA